MFRYLIGFLQIQTVGEIQANDFQAVDDGPAG